MDNNLRAKRRAFVVEDSPLNREGLVNLLEERGYDVIAECSDAESALEYLTRDHGFTLIMVDKRIPEEKGGRETEGVGPNLLLTLKDKFPFIGPLVLYTTMRAPNLGDIQRVYQIGASALAAPAGAAVEDFAKALDLIITGHQVLSPLFSRLGAGAVDPKHQCPLDPVEYYCARLISEHRGKEGSALKWGGGITVHIIDELLDDIYDKLNRYIKGFVNLPKEKKQQVLAKWYHDRAVESFGTARSVDYEPRRARRHRWPPRFDLNEEDMLTL
jgi:DNA-binding NarL/FixJ family response regulator